MQRRLIDPNNDYETYFRALSIWNEVYNYKTYALSDEQLRNRILECISAIWNVKDWFKKSRRFKASDVESFINDRIFLPIIGDLANTTKHRLLRKRSRVDAKEEPRFYLVLDHRQRKIRDFYFVSDKKGNKYEIFEVLRGALDEWGEFILRK